MNERVEELLCEVIYGKLVAISLRKAVVVTYIMNV